MLASYDNDYSRVKEYYPLNAIELPGYFIYLKNLMQLICSDNLAFEQKETLNIRILSHKFACVQPVVYRTENYPVYSV